MPPSTLRPAPFVEQLAVGKPLGLDLDPLSAKPPMDGADRELTAPPCRIGTIVTIDGRGQSAGRRERRNHFWLVLNQQPSDHRHDRWSRAECGPARAPQSLLACAQSTAERQPR